MLIESGLTPSLVVTSPDRPVGRKQIITPPPTKALATASGIEVFQPASFKDRESLEILTKDEWDLFVVVAYNHILPSWLIELPKHKTINLHPSLLPKLRGPSPIRTAILENVPDAVGVSVMLLDEDMDHGPILSQSPCEAIKDMWPVPGPQLDQLLTLEGATLLCKTIPNWVNKTIEPQVQNHEEATYTKKFTKGSGELKLDPQKLPSGDTAFDYLLKIYAFAESPGTYFMHQGKRVKITTAHLSEQKTLVIDRVIPEGKSEMDFTSYLQSLNS